MPYVTISNAADAMPTAIPPRIFSIAQPPSLSAFQKLCAQTTLSEQYPLSATVESNVPIYDVLSFDPVDVSIATPLEAEWHQALFSGPGVVVLRHMFSDLTLLKRVNEVFQNTINLERKASRKGDHFAGNGKNDRIWNSFSKHCLQDPPSFLQYYSNPWLALISDAWLGPGYRVTAQVNIVKPGGTAQTSHRDYHLGFQTADVCARYPIPMQIASQLLTLQGAVAHSDMPDGTGSTRLLPFSQQFAEGFMAYRLPEFNEFFLSKYASLPLKMGDGVFFNPALFHAAGSNHSTDCIRRANLLQISSAFGKPMETVESLPLIERCWHLLRQKYDDEGCSNAVKAFVSAVAVGYPFPTNLDKRTPGPEGLPPESEQQTILRGLRENWDKEKILRALHQIIEDSRS